MQMQEQVYGAIQARLKRLCASEYRQAPKKRNGKLKAPLSYSGEVTRLLELSSKVLDSTPKAAETIMAEITTGAIQHKFLEA